MGNLLLVSCSASKWNVPAEIPAIIRYDGPLYRVLRSYLRTYGWPHPLKLAVLSAEYGLIGGLAPIRMYDRRMTYERAKELEGQVLGTLKEWANACETLTVICGRDYLQPLSNCIRGAGFKNIEIADGSIGRKLQFLHDYLQQRPSSRRSAVTLAEVDRLRTHQMYFLPDWDDMLDEHYDFENDHFSTANRKERHEVHVTSLMGTERVCDGILVSLAQSFGNKGLLKAHSPTDIRSLAPEPLRDRFGLQSDQFLFGDCGAFSYVHKSEPAITVEQAVSLYELHEFDLGASVDHIPAPFLSLEEQERRIALTRENARAFIAVHRHLRCRFTPVGVIQGTSAESYASQLLDYVEMGYRYIGIGGLVFRTDAQIEEIVRKIIEAKQKVGRPLWIHLFGIFRPRLQPVFRELGISSFDSATYFRKAWLRSDQNYLGVDGKWYAAIRVPVSTDPRNRKKLLAKGVSLFLAERLERAALKALHLYGKRQLSLRETLDAVLAYDELVDRNEKRKTNLARAYELTLEARPWERCPCPVCQALGIDVVIFRGTNRNKRRGIHNTWLLYRRVTEA